VSEAQKEALEGLGILNGKGVEHFSGCLTIPLFDESGKVVSFYGRVIDNKRKVKHLYSPGPHKGLVNRKAVKVYREEIILTESVLDALSLIEIGIENVIPCYGVNGFTDEHLKALKDNRVKTVVLAFDADDAGRKGAEKLKEKLLAEGFLVKVIEPPSSKDWNEALTKGVSKESILSLTNQAEISSPEEELPEAFTVRKEGPKHLFTIAGVTYRLLGVKEFFVSNLRVNIQAVRGEEKHLDNVDLYSARSRNSFSTQLSHVLNLETVRIEKDLLRIVEHLEEERDKILD
jgi:DNA primase